MEIINVTDEVIEINVTEAVVNIVTQDGAYPLPSNVFSVFGRVGNVVGQAGDYTTSIVAEGTNLYFTNARSRAAISENITGINYDSASGIFTLDSGYLIPTQAMLDAKVPYTGATGNVTLGEHQLAAGQVAFDQTPTGSAGVGILRWNDTDGTLDLGLKGGNVTLQLGQEQVKRVVNGTGINLTEAAYQVVKVSGAQGQRLQVALAQANNDLNSATTLGIVTENINNNQEGFITTSGEVRGINTTGSLQGETWADGDVLYLSPSVAGKITNIKPVAPNHMVILGYVEYAHQNNGKIFVKVDNGYELDELHNVKITDPANNQALVFDSSDNVWKNESIDSALGYTPVPTTRTISTTAPLTGGGDLSTNRTLSMPAATTSASGYLTSTDWNTFNGKQPLIAAGTTAQYYRGDKTFQTLDTLAVPENTNLYYTAARFNTAFSGKTTTDLAEGTNLYFTSARAQAAISGTAPISVASGVVSISQATGSSNGYLSSTDWNTFNNKQAALNGTGFVKISGTTISYDNSTYLTTIEGITAGGELSGTYASPSLVNSAVTGKILSGVNITGGTISDTDSILTAFGKLQNQVNGLIGGSIYKGTWNASTNTPTLASGVGSKGDYYIVSVAGTTDLDGITDWNVGDWAIYDGTAWQQVDNTDAVVSVNGETGAVSLTTTNITEGTNLYFTNARSIASTLTGYTSGAGTISSSDTILTAIQKLNGNVSGLVTGVSSVFGRTGVVTAQSGDYTTTQVTEGTNLYYTEGRVSANTDVAANTAARHAAVTLGTANGLSLSTQQLSLGLASGSATGALSSTDWNTFNGKQAALNGTGFVKISGTTITYDNSTYLTTSSAASTYLPLTGGTLTGALSGTSATFSGATQDAVQTVIRMAGRNASNQVKALDFKLTAGTPLWTISTAADGTDVGLNIMPNGTSGLSLAYTGAATFSSSVTAGSTTYQKIGLTFPSTYVSKLGFGLNAGDYGSIQYDESGNELRLNSNYPTGLSTFYTNGSERMRITSGGNVGIGTSSPNNTASGRTVLDINGTSTSWINQSVGGSTISYIGANSTNAFWNTDGAYYLAIGTNNTERMRITSGGNVGIGLVPSGGDGILSTNGYAGTFGDSSKRRGMSVFSTSAENSDQPGVVLGYDTSGAGIIAARTNSSGQPLAFWTYNGSSWGERMRITSGGNVLIGTTTDNGYKLQVDGGGTAPLYLRNTGASSGNFWKVGPDTANNYLVYNQSNTGVYLGNGSTSWTANSDERLKNINGYIENALDKIMTLRPVNFSWKSDNSKKEVLGLIAQDVEKVFPQVVDRNKLPSKPDENKIDDTEYLGVRYQELVPVLIAAIQELKAEVDQLRAN